jgi:hypothetical protein
MRLDVAGAIANGVGWKWVSDAAGNPVGKREAIAWLAARLAEGKRFLPVGDCEGFDFSTGHCPGHKDQDVGGSTPPR